MQILTGTVNDFVANQFAAIPEVSYIFAEQNADFFSVTIVISRHDDDVLDRVIEFERNVITEFKHLSFDFSVLFQDGKDISDLVSPSTPLYSRT